MMTKELKVFDYEGAQLRTIEIDGEVWFVAKDVCDILELSNPTEALRALDEDEKNTLRISEGNLEYLNVSLGKSGRGNPNMNVINEPGLYALVFRSNKPEAKQFSRWVRHEVLPQIRKTGTYTFGSTTDIEAIHNLAVEQAKLASRKKFWMSLYDAFRPMLETALKANERGFYVLPDCAKDDSNDMHVLRTILSAARELMQNKIQAIEQRENLLDCLVKF